jgi:hypothetical protein
MDSIAVRISGCVFASVGGSRTDVPSADYYADEVPVAVARHDRFGMPEVPLFSVWRLTAIGAQCGPAHRHHFDLTDEELSRYVVSGEITILEGIWP